MSNIMRKLKNLEKNVSGRPGPGGVSGVASSNAVKRAPKSARRGNAQTNTRTILLLTVAIVLGILGYFAGMRSNRGSDIRNDGAVVSTTISYEDSAREIPVEGDVALEGVRSSGDGTSEEMEGDLSTLVFEDEPILPPKVPTNRETVQTGPAGGSILMGQDRSVPKLELTDSSPYDSEKMAALTAAILRATEEPLSNEEDKINKEIIRRVNILGVVEETDGVVAIISGANVQVGENYRHFRIEDITRNYVVFSHKGKLYRKYAR